MCSQELSGESQLGNSHVSLAGIPTEASIHNAMEDALDNDDSNLVRVRTARPQSGKFGAGLGPAHVPLAAIGLARVDNRPGRNPFQADFREELARQSGEPTLAGQTRASESSSWRTRVPWPLSHAPAGKWFFCFRGRVGHGCVAASQLYPNLDQSLESVLRTDIGGASLMARRCMIRLAMRPGLSGAKLRSNCASPSFRTTSLIHSSASTSS